MKKLLLSILVVLVIAGCASVQPTEPSQQVEEPEAEEAPPAEPEPEQATVLSAEIQDAIDQGLKPGVRSSMPVQAQRMVFGDVFVFGVGVQNVLSYDDTFLITVAFDKAYDRYTNIIEVDENAMNAWLKTNLDEFELAKGGKETISIVMEVGEIKPGVGPQIGTYVFDVETLNKRGGHFTNKDYVGKREITIQIR